MLAVSAALRYWKAASVNRPVTVYSSDVTIVIPAKNEEETLPQVLEQAAPYGRLMVIDGHSGDDTARIAQRAGARVITDGGKGKGEALRAAIPHIQTGITVFMDADGSHDPADIPRLVEPLTSGAADHVTASRLIGGSSELHGGFDECFRLMGSSFITACINWKFGVRLSDSQNGFRALRTEVLRDLQLRANLTTIEQEMIMETLRKGYRMAEVPAHEYPRRGGKSKINLQRVWPAYLLSLLKGMLR